MNIVPFDTAKLPAHLMQDAAQANTDLTAHAGAGFPVISIKGKTFAIVREGDRKIIPNQKDPDSPATHIDMVLVKANKQTSKVFYLAGYDEKAEAKKPDCYSNDGIKPADDSEMKQNSICATCKWNQWGSKTSTDGVGGKGKACQDAVRIAIATPGLVNDPYLIRVPPASIRALGELGSTLAKRGVSYQAVVTRISFVAEAATPQLTFKPVGFLDAETYQKVREVADTDVVRSILGMNQVSVEQTVTAEPVAPVVQPVRVVTQEEVLAAMKPVVKKKEPEVKPDPLGGFAVDLSAINFDD